MYIANTYLHPRTEGIAIDDDKTENIFRQILRQDNTIIVGDVNAHSTLWFSPTTDHRGDLIANIINDSDHIIINADTPTRRPFSRQDTPHQQPTSPDITAIPMRLLPHTTWTTKTQLSSDHLPILTTINTHLKIKLRLTRTFINYKKARWEDFTADIEEKLTNENLPDDVHKANKRLTQIIQLAHKAHIPQGIIKTRNSILPENIRQLITQRNNMRELNSSDPRLSALNTEITKEIQNHKRHLWREHINKVWDYKQNSSMLYETIKRLQNKRSIAEPNRTISFNNIVKVTDKEIANAFTKQYTDSSPKQTDRNNRKINWHFQQLESTPVRITRRDTIQALQKTSNKKSLGPDKIAPIHLKHLGPRATEAITTLFNNVLNKNIIPHTWKLARLAPVHKPNKDKNEGTSYRPISLLSPLAKTLEKIVLSKIRRNIPNTKHQHGYKPKHSTATAVQEIVNTITMGFNQEKPPERTITIALDMSKAFDTVHLHKLLDKLRKNTTIPNTFLKFISNYIKGRKGYTTYNNSTSRQRTFNSGVPQGGVLSPTLFNIYMADMPSPPQNNQTLVTYADDINTTTRKSI